MSISCNRRASLDQMSRKRRPRRTRTRKCCKRSPTTTSRCCCLFALIRCEATTCATWTLSESTTPTFTWTNSSTAGVPNRRSPCQSSWTTGRMALRRRTWIGSFTSMLAWEGGGVASSGATRRRLSARSLPSSRRRTAAQWASSSRTLPISTSRTGFGTSSKSRRSSSTTRKPPCASSTASSTPSTSSRSLRPSTTPPNASA
mmetsp:Transcript_65449/g.136358  ORF Transcript_65449/g.136358 Transcript_65449/m.136358 type:complete len:202 (+) Transcript_65449:287-892(+)